MVTGVFTMPDTQSPQEELEVSVVVPISERHDDLAEHFYAHQAVINKHFSSAEFIFIVDGYFPSAEKVIDQIIQKNSNVKKIKFNRNFGEAKAIDAGYAESSGKLILTLAAYFQVEPAEIEKLITEFNDSVDVLFGCRYPRKDNFLNKLQSTIFHKLVNKISNESFNDISCSARLIRRDVLGKIHLYGDMHRFIPLLAVHKGFKVKEIPLKQAPQDRHLRVYKPGVYIRRLLDILTLFFLIKFTQKPLRFFGLLGTGIGFTGAVISAITIWQRLFGDQGLSERPLFLVGILFLLVGLQTFFIGLVAEIVLFMHMPSQPEYNIEEVVE